MDNDLNVGTEAYAGNNENFTKDIGGINRKLQTAKETITQAQSLVSDKAKQYADITDGYVRANPWKALGVVAAAGVLVGILLARR